jgi:hypothetical protein
MSFETHLTLNASNSALFKTAREFASDHSLKWTQIELNSGFTPTQPMLTFWGQSCLGDQLRRANLIRQELGSLQIQVVRIKVETPFPGAFVPNDGCTGQEHPNQYFECHVKLRLSSEADLVRLRSLAALHRAHVSRNAIKTFENGQSERFVTQRSYECSSATVQLNQFELTRSLEDHGFEIVEIESEFVLYDSNFALDAGWN